MGFMAETCFYKFYSFLLMYYFLYFSGKKSRYGSIVQRKIQNNKCLDEFLFIIYTIDAEVDTTISAAPFFLGFYVQPEQNHIMQLHGKILCSENVI